MSLRCRWDLAVWIGCKIKLIEGLKCESKFWRSSERARSALDAAGEEFDRSLVCRPGSAGHAAFEMLMVGFKGCCVAGLTPLVSSTRAHLLLR